MGKLSVAKINRLDRPGMYADGDTLYLNVARGGSKSWVQRIRIAGKQTDLGLGGFPLVSIAEARDTAIDNRRTVRAGGNPLADKRKAKLPTFREAAEQTLEAHSARLRHKADGKTGSNGVANWSATPIRSSATCR